MRVNYERVRKAQQFMAREGLLALMIMNYDDYRLTSGKFLSLNRNSILLRWRPTPAGIPQPGPRLPEDGLAQMDDRVRLGNHRSSRRSDALGVLIDSTAPTANPLRTGRERGLMDAVAVDADPLSAACCCLSEHVICSPGPR